MKAPALNPEAAQKLREPYFIYLLVIGFSGLLLSAWGVVTLVLADSIIIFALLLLLAVAAQFSTTSVPVSGRGGITYQVAPAVVVSVIPFYGPFAAALLNSFSSFSLWVIKPSDSKTWKKSKEQLFFNMGMSSISVFVAGWTYIGVRSLFENYPILAATVPWLVMATVYDQVNLSLLLVIVRLKSGREANIWAIWKENTWAVPISILLLAAGGGLLSYAVAQYDWIGAIVFFLPIFLSAFAFRSYVRQMKTHMDNLESIIAERTGDLATAVQELESTNHELEQLATEKDAFLAVLTHDMKSPLTTIGIYGELLQSNPESLSKNPRMADVLISSQSRLLDLVNNILDLEKMQTAESIPLHKEMLNLPSVLEGLKSIMEAQAMEKEIAFNLRVAEPLTIIYADRSQMERAITNLISNAIKYTAKGGNVEVTVGHEAGAATVAVMDNGYGIPADELPFIFDRYRRVSKHRDKALGTGLGLAITRGLVEAHDGEIFVTSCEDVGSEFVVRLPLANPETL